MAQIPGAEAFVRMLQLHGVKHVFGLCGDTSLPLYDALYRLDHGIQHVLTRDERLAAYMADRYARVGPRGRVRGAERRPRPPALVDVVCQLLQEVRAPVSEWIA
jgi:glyoxylate carboligase